MKSINKILILITIATYPLFNSCSSVPSNIRFENSDDNVLSGSSGAVIVNSALPQFQAGQVFYVGPPAVTATPFSATPIPSPTSTVTPTPKVTPSASVTPTATPTPSPTPTQNSGGSSSGGGSSSSGGSTGATNISGDAILSPDFTKPQDSNSGSIDLNIDSGKPQKQI